MKRRTFLIGTGAVVTAPSFLGVAVGQTASGNVELTADATLPANTQVLIEIFEDTSADGTADNTQELSIDDGTNTYEFDQLTGETNEGNIYWIDVQLSTTDEDVTPEVDSLTITLPGTPPTTTEEPPPTTDIPDNRLDFGSMWEDFYVFILFVILGVAFLGLMAGSFTLASFGAFAVFVHLAVGTGDPLLTNILTVAIVVVLMSMGFKIWRAEGLA